MLPVEAYKDGKAVMNVQFIDLHLLECIQEQHISGGSIINENSLDHAIGDQQGDDWSIVVRVNEPCGFIIIEANGLIYGDVGWQLGDIGLRVGCDPCMSSSG